MLFRGFMRVGNRKVLLGVSMVGVVVAATAATVTFADAASSYTAWVSDSTHLNFVARPRTSNDVIITRSGNTFTIVDRVSIAPGTGCSWVGRDVTRVRCQTQGAPTDISVQLDDQNDSVTNATDLPAYLDGGSGEDVLLGGTGRDTLSGGPGADVMRGGGDEDLVTYADHRNGVTVDLDGQVGDGEPGEGDAVGTDVEWLTGGSGNDVLTGNDDTNVLRGGPGNDILRGAGGGGDWLFGDAGSDDMSGGPGRYDFVSYESATTGVTATINGARGDDGARGEGDTIHPDVENLIGGPGNDTLVGNSEGNLIEGGAGADTIYGAGAKDELHGSAGNDFLNGGDGDDGLDGGDGNDQVIGAFGNDYLVNGADADAMYGGPDTDTVAYFTNAPVTADLTGSGGNDGQFGERDTIGSDVENLYGGSGDDHLTGNSKDNLILGGAGNDVIFGGAGNDRLVGEPGPAQGDAGSDSSIDRLDGGEHTGAGDGCYVRVGGATVNCEYRLPEPTDS